MIIRRFCLVILTVLSALNLPAADPTETSYSWTECQGSAMPYPAPEHIAAWPDSLTPVMINHVGRHGARFPASPRHCNILTGALRKAESEGSITPAGRSLLKLVQRVTAEVDGNWGALDPLGMAEQRGIAARMITTYPELFKNSTVNAISSYSPRCIMSMDEFTHQLARMDNSVELNMASGRRFSPLVRFFDGNAEYTEFRTSEALKTTLHDFRAQHCPLTQLKRVLGDKFNLDDYSVPATDIAMAEYSVLAGLSAMGIDDVDVKAYLTPSEQNALWSIANLQHYLQHSASTLSSVPAAIAAPLLDDIIAKTDGFIAGDPSVARVNLRFGHAETLMPLLSLMHVPGCYYLTNYFDTVGLHWRDFDIVPMAANLQIILFQGPSNRYYVRVKQKKKPVSLIPGSDALYVDWSVARNYLQRCMPLY